MEALPCLRARIRLRSTVRVQHQKKQAQGGLSYLRTRKLHGTRQSRPHPSSRVSRTWEEVLTLSNEVPPYSTFLIDKGRAPERSATRCPMVSTQCSASDRMHVPARPAQHVHRRVPDLRRRTRRSASTIRGGTADTTIGRVDADQAGARPLSIRNVL